jgi:lysophospholipase L1-like esterase
MWTVSRFPTWNLTVRNVGIGGDRSPGGNSRFARDVLIHKPTAMTVDFGMNDGGYRPFDEAGFTTYKTGLQGIADQARAAGIRVAWITPQPVEKAENGPALPGYNETLEKYSGGVSEIAAAMGGAFVDQFHPYLSVLDTARAADPANRIGGGDPVHPGPPGQALMAYSILRGLGFPTVVSKVTIDAAAGSVSQTQNCEVANLTATAQGVSFTRQDAALPFFPTEAAPILAWVPIREELNDYTLTIAGLEAGDYEIVLDGELVARRSAADLAAGVNLAEAVLAAGPVARQVALVWEAVQAKNRYYHDRVFRGVVLAQVAIPDFLGIEITAEEIQSRRDAAVADRMTQLPQLDQAIRTALAPRAHQVEVRRAP